jgi:hypothetical protein
MTILRFRDLQRNRQLLRLEDLLQVKGVDKILIRDFVYTGRHIHETKPRSEPKPDPDEPEEPVGPVIGVLLPLRLETRFYGPEQPGDSWRLRLRIIPDRASMDTHDPGVTEAEFESVVAFWAAAEGDIGSDLGRDASRILAPRVGPSRAAWLAQRFTPASDGSVQPPPRTQP